MKTQTVTIEQINPATTKRQGLWLVKRNGNIIGMLQRFKNSQTDTHPWKAFAGYGMNAQFLGAFYEVDGGKAAAVKAITG